MRPPSFERLRLYAIASMATGCLVLALLLWQTPERLAGATDFTAFFNAGRIVNEYPTSDLYSRELQMKLFAEAAPTIDPAQASLFVYTPFFAALFSPFAVLPYPVAFAAWIVTSLAMFVVGFRLVWMVSGLSDVHWKSALAIAVSFVPFYSWCLGMGQTSAFGFFFLALAIYLDRNARQFGSGCVLALLLYKPTLLVLLVPMLLLTKRWRSLAGFLTVGSVLGLISLALIRLSGLPAYFDMAAGFAKAKTGTHLTMLEIDAYSFFVALTRGSAWAPFLFLALTVAILPFVIKAWRVQPENAWATAIAWTLVLNFYVLMYDASLLVLSVVLFVGTLREVTHGLRWLLIALFLLPWIETATARTFGFQPITVALIVFGCYQIASVMRPHRLQSVEPRGQLSAA